MVGRLKPDDCKGREGVELEIEDAADPRRRLADAESLPDGLARRRSPRIYRRLRADAVPSSIG